MEDTREAARPSLASRVANLTRRDLAALAFVAPAFLIVIALLVYPLASSVYYSFTNKHLLRPVVDFVGLQNFTQILGDARFWDAFQNSIWWTAASIIGQLGLGFALAFALNGIRRGSGAYRTMLIVPWAFPVVIIAFSWRWIFNDVGGFLPNLLFELGLTEARISLLANPGTVFWAALFVNLWFGAPLFMVNILSALKTIPAEQLEAAVVDGANAWQRFRYITLRHIRNVIGLLVILRTIWVFNNFDMLFLLTGGGPAELTTTLPIFAYRTGWGLKMLGTASAVTILLLIFLLILSLGMFRLLNRWEKQDR